VTCVILALNVLLWNRGHDQVAKCAEERWPLDELNCEIKWEQITYSKSIASLYTPTLETNNKGS
jgi:hypothetical protein